MRARGPFLALALALWGGLAGAQTQPPDETRDPESRRRFQLCRAAIFYHLAAPETESRLPHALAETLLEQINLIMFETVRSAPAASVDESRRALGFVEQFFVSFAQTIAETRTRFANVAERERMLLDCVPHVWALTRERIDYLILWRERAVGAPDFPNRLGDRLTR